MFETIRKPYKFFLNGNDISDTVHEVRQLPNYTSSHSRYYTHEEFEIKLKSGDTIYCSDLDFSVVVTYD